MPSLKNQCLFCNLVCVLTVDYLLAVLQGITPMPQLLNSEQFAATSCSFLPRFLILTELGHWMLGI